MLGIFNGNILPVEEIKISPFSRAYTFSDAVYEVVPFFKGKPIAMDLHMERLVKSCHAIGIEVEHSVVQVEIIELANLALNNSNGYVYYQLTRGVDKSRSHIYSNNLQCESFGYAAHTSQTIAPQKAKIVQDIRWARCDIKSTALLGNILLMNQAYADGCSEIIMHRNNFITESGSSNIFIVKDAKIMTPPREANILAGITRELLIKNFSKSFEIAEEPCHIDLLAEANVVFLTSSTKGIMPINEIEGNNYIFSKDHPIFMDLKNQFDKFLETAF